jgi:hypothetical protein
MDAVKKDCGYNKYFKIKPIAVMIQRALVMSKGQSGSLNK